MSQTPDRLLIIIFSTLAISNGAKTRPNVIFMIADDLGWNDVSFHGSNQVPTPNIDALAYSGTILNSHYTQAICTPSRTALLTAKYPMRLGMQGQPLGVAEPRSLPEGKLLPEYLKDLGYSTNLVGKWHLGYDRWNTTPTYRGFDYFFGYYNGWISYYDYEATWRVNATDYTGFDLRCQTKPVRKFVGQYATDTFTKRAVDVILNHNTNKPLFLMLSHLAPHAGNEGKLLEAPLRTINRFRYITDSNRRTYAAMVAELDKSVGTVVATLAKKNMLSNSIIVFISDNGSPTRFLPLFPNWGSNYPLRGIKGMLNEGGIRGVACMWSPLLKPRVSNGLMHITDWLPTLLTAVGGDVRVLPSDTDGIDQWASLVNNRPSPRSEILLNIDEVTGNSGVRKNNWKLIVGRFANGSFDQVSGESGQSNMVPLFYNTFSVYYSLAGISLRSVTPHYVSQMSFVQLRDAATVKCGPLNDVSADNLRLYDIENDPCELSNLAVSNPSVVQEMLGVLAEYQSKLVPQLNRPFDVRDDPKLFGYTWNPWLDCKNPQCTA